MGFLEKHKPILQPIEEHISEHYPLPVTESKDLINFYYNQFSYNIH